MVAVMVTRRAVRALVASVWGWERVDMGLVTAAIWVAKFHAVVALAVFQVGLTAEAAGDVRSW